MSEEKPVRLLTTADVRAIEKILDERLLKIDTYARRHSILIEKISGHAVHIERNFLPVIVDAMARIPELQPFAEGFGQALANMGYDVRDFGETIMLMATQVRKVYDELRDFNRKVEQAIEHK